MHDSFYKNSMYLLINMAFSTVAGFFFVVICAHLFTQKDFGYATSMTGALGLAVAFSNLGMNRTIVRFLGRSETKSRDLVSKLSIVLIFALLSGIILSSFLKSFGIEQVNPLTVFIFIITVLVCSVKSLFDFAFIAIRNSSGALIENSFFGITKLVFPVFVVGSGFLGIFSAQLAGALVAVLASVIILRVKHGFEFRIQPSKDAMIGKWRFAMGSYTSDLVGGLPTSILPIIVVARFGPISGALWYVAMQITNFLLTVSGSVNQAMFAEMANERGDLRKFVKKASITMYGLLIPLSISVFIFAPNILTVFHGNYVAAQHVLRLMTVFALLGVANYITGSILLLFKKVAYITFVNAVNAGVVIFYCVIFAHNVNGVAIGWMLGELANLILFVGGGIFVARQHGGSLDWDAT